MLQILQKEEVINTSETREEVNRRISEKNQRSFKFCKRIIANEIWICQTEKNEKHTSTIKTGTLQKNLPQLGNNFARKNLLFEVPNRSRALALSLPFSKMQQQFCQCWLQYLHYLINTTYYLRPTKKTSTCLVIWNLLMSNS